MKNSIMLATLFSISVALVSFQNCAKLKFDEIEPAKKVEVLETTAIFETDGEPKRDPALISDSAPVAMTPSADLTDYSPETPNNSPEAPKDTPEAPKSEVIPVDYLCSANKSAAAGGNLATKPIIYLSIVDSKKKTICQFKNSTIRDEMLSSKKALVLDTLTAAMENAKCKLSDGAYSVVGRASASLTKKSLFNIEFQSTKAKNKKSKNKKAPLVLADFNPNREPFQAMPQLKCDKIASPLVIHMKSDVEKAQPLKLTSQENGIVFDILGRNSEPEAFSPKRISWHRSHQYYFIALPDANGEVKGIDQLFGDNTFGIDGQFAADGYAALAKFDGKSADGKSTISAADGLISREDEIFSKLRLWQDLNFDGIAQKHELLSLEKVGVTIIDLRYDASYSERDQYGNETKYKSVVKTKDGRYHLLFDVWFAYKEL